MIHDSLLNRKTQAATPEQRAAFQANLNDPRHGTVNGYGNLRCRCSRCYEGWIVTDPATGERLTYNAYKYRETNDRRRARTEAQADADFDRLCPDGKLCRGCDRVLPKDAFNRGWTRPDGRQIRCTPCMSARIKRNRELPGFWRSAGIDPTRCLYCGVNQTEESDHFVPLDLEGPDDMSNLVPACRDCNRGRRGKHRRDPHEWLLERHPKRYDVVIAAVARLNDITPQYTTKEKP